MKNLKRISYVLAALIAVYFVGKMYRRFSVPDEQNETRTAHFIIHHYGIYQEEAQAVADALEENYGRVRTELKDPEHEVINVYLHPIQEAFNTGTHLSNSTANGTSRGPNEFHVLWTNWYNSIFPDDPVKTAVHEFAHCVQLNILINLESQRMDTTSADAFNKAFEDKFLKEYPQWFWEAICDYEAGIVNRWSVKYGMSKGLSLKELNHSNQIYNVGYTLIDFIATRWGKEKLAALITSYGDIQAVLGINEADFEQQWRGFVAEKY